MKIIDKNGKELKVDSRVQTGTTASTKKYQGTVMSYITNTTPGSKQPSHIRILFDNGAFGSYDCWETLVDGTFQCEEVELLDGLY